MRLRITESIQSESDDKDEGEGEVEVDSGQEPDEDGGVVAGMIRVG